ncbi:MAG: ATP-binding cassette domain-containing protein [Erysipelotrichia bacterium]|nr:ATP-binding cassette domain-containing protein [Erysipelotrichia bacterium]
MIKLTNVSKSFNQEVIHNFSYTFKKPQKYLICGKSGCGKTTLINLIMGLIDCDQGKIENKLTFSCAFQYPRLLENLSCKKNIEIFTKKQGLPAELLTENILNQPVKTLSGGQKQKLSIFIACKAGSDCLILDEPFNNLDEASIKEVINFINKNINGRILIVSSHLTDHFKDFQIINLN